MRGVSNLVEKKKILGRHNNGISLEMYSHFTIHRDSHFCEKAVYLPFKKLFMRVRKIKSC